MKQRIGYIIGIAGVLLLVKPNVDTKQVMVSFNYMIANYWPVGLIILGVFLLSPRKKKHRGKIR